MIYLTNFRILSRESKLDLVIFDGKRVANHKRGFLGGVVINMSEIYDKILRAKGKFTFTFPLSTSLINENLDIEETQISSFVKLNHRKVSGSITLEFMQLSQPNHIQTARSPQNHLQPLSLSFRSHGPSSTVTNRHHNIDQSTLVPFFPLSISQTMLPKNSSQSSGSSRSGQNSPSISQLETSQIPFFPLNLAQNRSRQQSSRSSQLSSPISSDRNTSSNSFNTNTLPANATAQFVLKEQEFREKLKDSSGTGRCEIEIHRSTILHDSYLKIMRASPEKLKKRLFIKYTGEEGIDYGGVSRDYFHALSREVFNPSYCLFEYVSEEDYSLKINNLSYFNEEHLEYFKFTGRVIGLALYHNVLLEVQFIDTFYKMILGQNITLDDLKKVDRDYFNSLNWIAENNIDGVLDLTFTLEETQFDKIETVELIPDGGNIPVTNDNKALYIELFTNWKVTQKTQSQFKAFMSGLNELIPPSLITNFSSSELQLLISGVKEINVEDWQEHTIYEGYSYDDPIVTWFWKIVREMNDEQRSKFLQFVTGISALPANGFEGLWGLTETRLFTIKKMDLSNFPIDGFMPLPITHTCFNRIDIPNYPSLEVFKKKLVTAMNESAGFGIE